MMKEGRSGVRALIKNSGRELVGNLTVADSIFTRLKGLLGRVSLAKGSGLWLKPCKGVHTFGMKFSIDIILLDRYDRVINIITELKPNRITSLYSTAATILELPATTAFDSGLKIGDQIEFIE